MDVIGERFACGEAFIPELIMAGEIMQGVGRQAEAAPGRRAPPSERLGTVVLGTVQGDIHDIGKDIVGTMLDIAGFDVVDLGVDVPVASVRGDGPREQRPDRGHELPAHVRLRGHEADVAAIAEAGLRGGLRVMVGGAPMTEGVLRVHRRRRLGQGRRRSRRAREAVDGRCLRCSPRTGTS